MHAPATFWAVSYVGRLLLIDVNPCIHTTTGEIDAQVAAPNKRPTVLVRFGGIAQIQVIANHTRNSVVSMPRRLLSGWRLLDLTWVEKTEVNHRQELHVSHELDRTR